MIKKNITINFCGRLFNIDEDAYALLDQYTESIRRYYKNTDGGDEIADDIEARIAEILEEENVNAIDIALTEKVIRQIGELKDITNGESGSENYEADTQDNRQESASERLREGANRFAQGVEDAAQHTWNTLRSDKRFYRDMQNGKVAGVLAGCSRYFGGSLLAWRLLFLILVIVPIPIIDSFGIGIIALLSYIILSIIAPEARTPEEMLQMKGEAVNPQNLAAEVASQTTGQTKRNGSTLSDIVKIGGCIILAPIILLFSGIFLTFICMSAVFVTAPVRWFTTWFNLQPEVFPYVETSFYIACIALTVALITLIYCCIHAALSNLNKTAPMSTRQRILWLVVFIISIVTLVASGVKTISDGRDQSSYIMPSTQVTATTYEITDTIE